MFLLFKDFMNMEINIEKNSIFFNRKEYCKIKFYVNVCVLGIKYSVRSLLIYVLIFLGIFLFIY